MSHHRRSSAGGCRGSRRWISAALASPTQPLPHSAPPRLTVTLTVTLTPALTLACGKAPLLATLKLTGCPGVSDVGVSALGSRPGARLKRLFLGDTDVIHAGLMPVVEACGATLKARTALTLAIHSLCTGGREWKWTLVSWTCWRGAQSWQLSRP